MINPRRKRSLLEAEGSDLMASAAVAATEGAKLARQQRRQQRGGR
jgi:hypothetical protein